MRLDSIFFNTSFYNTSSNTKLAVAYSKDGFTTDGQYVTGGVGPDGLPLTSTAPGSLEQPVFLLKENDGTSLNYRFALAGGEGVALQAGETLIIRLYYSCGSSSEGRYAKLKHVGIKGDDTSAAGIDIEGSLQPFDQNMGSPSEVQQYAISGTGLTNSITIIPPRHFQLSLKGKDDWKDRAAPLVLAPVNGRVEAVEIEVRLNASLAGDHSGNIEHSSPGATPVALPVSGSTGRITALGNEETVGEIRLWPNPCTDTIYIDGGQIPENATVAIFNEKGVLVKQLPVRLENNLVLLDVRELNSGLYFIEGITEPEQPSLRFLKL